MVKDPAGAAIPRCPVTLTNMANGAVVNGMTSASGEFDFPLVAPGTYSVEARARGFHRAGRYGLTVRGGDEFRVDIEVPLQSAAESLDVSDLAPTLESKASIIRHAIDAGPMRNLPTRPDQYPDLARLAPGVTPARFSRDGSFQANGMRGTENDFQLDGAPNTSGLRGLDLPRRDAIRPASEAIAEYQVVTGSFSAEYGQAAGAVVDVTVKSGTNQLHGSAYEYRRDSRLDALPYFTTDETSGLRFSKDQFGATLGGPLRKDHVWLFGSWESTRDRSGETKLSAVPTAAARSGDLSTFDRLIYDPGTLRQGPGSGPPGGPQNTVNAERSPFAGNVIPRSRMHPRVVPLLSRWPTENLPDEEYNYERRPGAPRDAGRFDSRLDWSPRDGHALFARASYGRDSSTTARALPEPAQPSLVTRGPSHGAALGYTATPRPSFVNELHAGYHWLRAERRVGGGRDTLGIPGSLAPDVTSATPVFDITGYAGLGPREDAPTAKTSLAVELSNSLAWVRGGHTFKFGGGAQWQRPSTYATQYGRSSFSFTGVYTQDPNNRGETGAPWADFLLGLASSATQGTTARARERATRRDWFAQADWRLTPRLTWNTGIRYELQDPFREAGGRQSNFIIEPGDPHYGRLVTADTAGEPRALVRRDANNLAPRMGLAFQVSPRLVVRAGAGVFYGIDEGASLSLRTANNPPFVISNVQRGDQLETGRAPDLGEGFPPRPAALRPRLEQAVSTPRDFPLPYVSQWSFHLQASLPRAITARAAYFGLSGMKLVGSRDANQALPGPGPPQGRTEFPAGPVTRVEPRVRSTYQGMNLHAERRFARGLGFSTAFTYGRSIDTASASSSTETTGTAVQPQDSRNVALERGPSDYDVRARLASTADWALPSGRGRLARGWSVRAVVSMQTGMPFTPVLGFDPTNTGTVARPDRRRSGVLNTRSVERWFDTTAFTPPRPFRFGNSGRNVLHGPGQRNFDLSGVRRFGLGEGRYFELRGEFFNAFNSPQFDNPDAVIGGSQAGQISSTSTDMRQVQLTVKFVF